MHCCENGILPSECCCPKPAARRKAFKDWLGQTEILLRARKVECEVPVRYLRNGTRSIGWAHEECRAHDDALQHLREMATKSEENLRLETINQT
jgi:hypothetical protein